MFIEQRVATEELKEVLSTAVRGERLSAALNHLGTDLPLPLIQVGLAQSPEVSRGPAVQPPQALHSEAPRGVDQLSE